MKSKTVEWEFDKNGIYVTDRYLKKQISALKQSNNMPKETNKQTNKQAREPTNKQSQNPNYCTKIQGWKTQLPFNCTVDLPVYCGSSVALWLGRWICNQEVLSSNPPPTITRSHFINSHLVSLRQLTFFTSFCLIYNIFLLASVSTISSKVLNTLTLKWHDLLSKLIFNHIILPPKLVKTSCYNAHRHNL